jgi:hypothetical protein
MPEKILKEERFILVYKFGGFIPWLVGPIAFEPVTRQHVMARST